MSIRPATIEDALDLAQVHVAAWQAAYRDQMPEHFLSSLSVTAKAEMWRNNLEKSGPAQTVVFEDNGKIVGFCVYGPSRDSDALAPNTGELIAINLIPEVWRHGFGTQLCDYVLAQARTLDWEILTLWVLKENERARKCYEKRGFVLDGTERSTSRLIGSPLHEVRYRQFIHAASHRPHELG